MAAPSPPSHRVQSQGLPPPRFAPAQLDRAEALAVKRPGQDMPDPPRPPKKPKRERRASAPASTNADPNLAPAVATLPPVREAVSAGAQAISSPPAALNPGTPSFRFLEWLKRERLPSAPPPTWPGRPEKWREAATDEQQWLQSTSEKDMSSTLRWAWKTLNEPSVDEQHIRNMVAKALNDLRSLHTETHRLPLVWTAEVVASPTTTSKAAQKPRKVKDHIVITIEESPEPETPASKPSTASAPSQVASVPKSPATSAAPPSRSPSLPSTASVIRPPAVKVRVALPRRSDGTSPRLPSASTMPVVYGSEAFIPQPHHTASPFLVAPTVTAPVSPIVLPPASPPAPAVSAPPPPRTTLPTPSATTSRPTHQRVTPALSKLTDLERLPQEVLERSTAAKQAAEAQPSAAISGAGQQKGWTVDTAKAWARQRMSEAASPKVVPPPFGAFASASRQVAPAPAAFRQSVSAPAPPAPPPAPKPREAQQPFRRQSLPQARPPPPSPQPSQAQPQPPRPQSQPQLPQPHPQLRHLLPPPPTNDVYIPEAFNCDYLGVRLPWGLMESFFQWRRTEGTDNAARYIRDWAMRIGWSEDQAVALVGSLEIVTRTDMPDFNELNRRARVAAEHLRLQAIRLIDQREAAQAERQVQEQREAQQFERDLQRLQQHQHKQQHHPQPPPQPQQPPLNRSRPSSSSGAPPIGLGRPSSASSSTSGQGYQSLEHGQHSPNFEGHRRVVSANSGPPGSPVFPQQVQASRRASGSVAPPQQYTPYAMPPQQHQQHNPPTWDAPQPALQRPKTAEQGPPVTPISPALSPSIPRALLDPIPPQPSAAVAARDALLQALGPSLQAMRSFVAAVESGEIGRSAQVLEEKWTAGLQAIKEAELGLEEASEGAVGLGVRM